MPLIDGREVGDLLLDIVFEHAKVFLFNHNFRPQSTCDAARGSPGRG
jgi:hypothetical protein